MSCFSGLLTENETWNWLYNGGQLKSTSKCDSRTPRTKKTTKCSHNHQLINVYKDLYNETCEENFFKKNADFNLTFFHYSYKLLPEITSSKSRSAIMMIEMVCQRKLYFFPETSWDNDKSWTNKKEDRTSNKKNT